MECLLEKTRPEKITFAFTMMLNLHVFFNESDWDTMADHQLSSSNQETVFRRGCACQHVAHPRKFSQWIFSLARRLGSSSMSKRCQRTARSLSADVAHEKCSRLRQVHGDFRDMFVHLVDKWKKKTSKTCKRALLKTFDIQVCSNKKHGQGNSQDHHTMQRTFLPEVYKSLFAVLLLAFGVFACLSKI